jgi:hypothetical protein
MDITPAIVNVKWISVTADGWSHSKVAGDICSFYFGEATRIRIHPACAAAQQRGISEETGRTG